MEAARILRMRVAVALGKIEMVPRRLLACQPIRAVPTRPSMDYLATRGSRFRGMPLMDWSAKVVLSLVRRDVCKSAAAFHNIAVVPQLKSIR